MALFGNKKATTKESPAVTTKQTPGLKTKHNLDAILVRPHFTEKAVNLSEKNVFAFDVKRDATKFQVRDAVKALYNVTPVKVNIVNTRPATRLKGSLGKKVKVPGAKKAYVYLKKGDTINLV